MAVAVEIITRNAHASLKAAAGRRGHTGVKLALDEPKAAEVMEQVVRRRIVGDVQVSPAVVVQVGRDHPHAAAVLVHDPGLGRHVDEPAAVVAEDVVGERGKARGMQ